MLKKHSIKNIRYHRIYDIEDLNFDIGFRYRIRSDIEVSNYDIGNNYIRYRVLHKCKSYPVSYLHDIGFLKLRYRSIFLFLSHPISNTTISKIIIRYRMSFSTFDIEDKASTSSVELWASISKKWTSISNITLYLRYRRYDFDIKGIPSIS